MPKPKHRDNYFARIDEVQLRRWYEVELLSQAQIAKRLQVSPSTVWERLKRAGVQVRSKREAGAARGKRLRPTITKRRLRDAYEVEGLSLEQGAKKLGIPASTFAMLLRRNGIPRRRASVSQYADSRYEFAVNETELTADYNGGMTVRALMRKYGKGDRWIRSALKRNGIVFRPRNRYMKMRQLSEQQSQVAA